MSMDSINEMDIINEIDNINEIHNINVYTDLLDEYEVFKPLFTNYAISNYGRVYSFYKNTTITPHVQFYNKNGNEYKYLVIPLFINGKKKSFRIHQLVAKAFIENPHNKKIVKHRNYDTFDNRPINLYYQ